MMKFLKQICYKKRLSEFANETVQLEFKHGATFLNMAQIKISNQTISFIKTTKIFLQIMDESTRVILFIYFIILKFII